MNLQKRIELNKRYSAAPGANYNNAQAAVIGSELEAMQSEGVAVTPDTIVKRASDASNPLHAHFTWDDQLAAYSWRKEEARHLVSHLVVVIDKEDGPSVPVKAVWSIERTPRPSNQIDQNQDNSDQSVSSEPIRPEYISVNRVLESPDMRAQVVQSALRELRSWAMKYQNLGLCEFSQIYEQVDLFAK